MNVNELDLTQASRAYGVANTPSFLVRKLQADAGIRALGQTCSAQDILAALRASVAVEADSPVDAVRPYALLVALWFKQEIEHLKEASKISAPEYRWFPVVSELLIQNFSPVQMHTIQLPGVLPAPQISFTSQASTSASPKIIIAHN